MIVYSKRALGLHLLLRLYGSAVVRTLLWGVLAGLQTGLLYLVPDHTTRFYESGRVPAYAVFATAVALLVIFRQNAGYGRYHEGRTRFQAMTAAWVDACCKALSFDGGSSMLPPDQASLSFRMEFVHTMSLLHATAVQFLRSDWELGNLCEHDPNHLPPWDAKYNPRFAPQLLDYLVLRLIPSRRLAFNAAFPIPVVGHLSSEEAVLLGQQGFARVTTLGRRSAAEATGVIEKMDALLFISSQGSYHRGLAERVYQVFYWTHEQLRLRAAAGGLQVPAPILTQVFGALQKGLEAFEHCRYLSDTPFPFTWAQLLLVMLLCLQFTVPFMAVTAFSDVALGVVFAWTSVQAYWALNEVSREMEEPYSCPPNDIPLSRLQFQFNERCLAFLRTQVPGMAAPTDLPHTA